MRKPPSSYQNIQTLSVCVCKAGMRLFSSTTINFLSTVPQEWSYTACGCVCTRSVVEFCKLEKKVLNASTCECEEPKTIVKNLNPGVPGKRTGKY